MIDRCCKCRKPNDRAHKDLMTCSVCSAKWLTYYEENKEKYLAHKRKRYAEDPLVKEYYKQKNERRRKEEKLAIMRGPK